MKVGSENYNIRAYYDWDLEPLASNMRQEDRDELWAGFHLEPEKAIEISTTGVMLRHITKVGCYQFKPVCIFGVSETPGSTALHRCGTPWMLGTTELEDHAFVFLKYSRKFIENMVDSFDWLENYVDARNLKSIEWLKWLGFDIEDAKPWGVEGLPFHRFTMDAAKRRN